MHVHVYVHVARVWPHAYHPYQVNFACAVWSPEQTLLKVSIYNSKSSLLGKGSKVICYLRVPVCHTPRYHTPRYLSITPRAARLRDGARVRAA
eukprot:scaffold35107_cov70-Phaeocystis_antarctica.AAC.5